MLMKAQGYGLKFIKGKSALKVSFTVLVIPRLLVGMEMNTPHNGSSSWG